MANISTFAHSRKTPCCQRFDVFLSIFSLKKTAFVQKELTFAQPKLYLLKMLQNTLGLQVTIISYISWASGKYGSKNLNLSKYLGEWIIFTFNTYSTCNIEPGNIHSAYLINNKKFINKKVQTYFWMVLFRFVNILFGFDFVHLPQKHQQQHSGHSCLKPHLW